MSPRHAIHTKVAKFVVSTRSQGIPAQREGRDKRSMPYSKIGSGGKSELIVPSGSLAILAYEYCNATTHGL